jgi:hypothetical protein
MGAAYDSAADLERDRAQRALNELAHLAPVVLVAAEGIGHGVDDDQLHLQVEGGFQYLPVERRQFADTAAPEFHQEIVFAQARHPVHRTEGVVVGEIARIDGALPPPQAEPLV